MSKSADDSMNGIISGDESAESGRSGVFFETDKALEQYLRHLAQIEPISRETETQLWKEILQLQKEFRSRISFFGISLSYAGTLLAACREPDSCGEILPQSLILAQKKKMIPYLENLKKTLADTHEKIRKAFQTKKTALLKQARDAASELFSGTPILVENIFHIYDDLKAYSILLNGKEEPETARTYRENSLFCTLQEFHKVFGELQDLYQELDARRRKIAEGNLRLVVSIAKHFHGRGVPFMDLIQEGNIGLMKAVDRFDFPLGHHFSTYATWWIRQCVFDSVGRQSRVIRLPVHMLNTISRINRMEQQLLQENGREPEPSEVAARLEMPVERVNSLKKMAVQPISLQASLYHDDNGNQATLEDSQDFCDGKTPVRELAGKLLAEKLAESIAALPPRYGDILRMRYGLDGIPQRSVAEISEHFKISKERIRQIEISALAKLRDPANIKLFEDYFS